ncbi:hypothetical protein LEP1GSC008_4247 [Leptospira kirschneri serovar Bulgarica str. Nikolaevo]|uniref:Uncharacterized protein n=1 Tax=Leptospira kirschneri serovar Bulgarica str. Nikolaevo TaxID=1240687 RepID=M6EZP0_9LEPT|nr:hypothetical protein LEP1GSC008_4247 [Leptospira kirschneri serovar Bulgarica str. Nikolaevo]
MVFYFLYIEFKTKETEIEILKTIFNPFRQINRQYSLSIF